MNCLEFGLKSVKASHIERRATSKKWYDFGFGRVCRIGFGAVDKHIGLPAIERCIQILMRYAEDYTVIILLLRVQTELRGLTGNVKFDKYGTRTGFVLDVLEVSLGRGLAKVTRVFHTYRNKTCECTGAKSLDYAIDSLHINTIIFGEVEFSLQRTTPIKQ